MKQYALLAGISLMVRLPIIIKLKQIHEIDYLYYLLSWILFFLGITVGNITFPIVYGLISSLLLLLLYLLPYQINPLLFCISQLFFGLFISASIFQPKYQLQLGGVLGSLLGGFISFPGSSVPVQILAEYFGFNEVFQANRQNELVLTALLVLISIMHSGFYYLRGSKNESLMHRLLHDSQSQDHDYSDYPPSKIGILALLVGHFLMSFNLGVFIVWMPLDSGMSDLYILYLSFGLLSVILT